ncbi:MAG: hypothetical protein ACW98F_08545 [Candidatus Hodarchaeales archaeon]|jgi:uncharacterized membrane protein (DUF485 family)
MNFERFNNYSPIFALFTCFILNLLVIMFFSWSLTLFAATIGGIICTNMKWGAITGVLGVVFAWVMSFVFSINDIVLQADQLGRLIIGANGAGGIIVLLIFIIGALFGFLGGTFGSGIRMMVFPGKIDL